MAQTARSRCRDRHAGRGTRTLTSSSAQILALSILATITYLDMGTTRIWNESKLLGQEIVGGQIA